MNIARKFSKVFSLLTSRQGQPARESNEEKYEPQHHVTITLDRSASRYAYKWNLVDTRARKWTIEDQRNLDTQVAVYVAHYADDHKDLGEHKIDMWF